MLDARAVPCCPEWLVPQQGDVMASNRKSRIPSTQRDIVTCEPLQRGTGRIALTDRDLRRHPLHRTPIPFRLHVSQQETVERDGTEGNLSERLGSNKLSGQLVHYLSEGERSRQRQEREWWNNLYLLDRIFEHAGDPPAPFTLDELDIALAWYRGRDLSECERTHYWIERACRRVQRFVRQRYFADNLVRPSIAA